jgi:hypothetical protein
MCKQYEGWSNYPTWAVKLWLDNDEIVQKIVLRHAAVSKTTTTPVALLSGSIEDLCTNTLGLVAPPTGIASDVFGWAIEQVNWREIARAYLEED